jgi:hypothetical protein
MRQRFWRGRLSTALAVTLAVIGAVAAVGAVQASGGDNGDSGNNGNGHTPITICHWVPAHGGSFVVITIDEEGLHGHGDHENDIIPAPEEGCPGAAGETAVPSQTHVASTKTVEVTHTVAVETETPVPATNTPSAATNTPVATGTVSGGGGGPNLTPSATNTTIVTATNTPGGDVGADTATPTETATATATSEGVAQGQGGGVLGEQVTPLAGGAEALPSAGTGSASNGLQDVYGFAALAFAAMAGAGMLVLGKRLYR